MINHIRQITFLFSVFSIVSFVFCANNVECINLKGSYMLVKSMLAHINVSIVSGKETPLPGGSSSTNYTSKSGNIHCGGTDEDNHKMAINLIRTRSSTKSEPIKVCLSVFPFDSHTFEHYHMVYHMDIHIFLVQYSQYIMCIRSYFDFTILYILRPRLIVRISVNT